MRLKIKFSKNNTPVPIHNQHLMNSYIHKCLGVNNEYHDSISNYNVSHLYGGKLNIKEGTLEFKDGGYIVASSPDGEFVNKLLVGVLSNKELFHGMKFSKVEHIEEQFVNGWNNFATLSPFLINGISNRFLTLDDPDFEVKVEDYLLNKLEKISSRLRLKLDLSDFRVEIDNHDSHKVKKILVKNVINHANQCHISIRTNKKVAKLLYNIGIGKSTGSGFGTIYKVENKHLYK